MLSTRSCEDCKWWSELIASSTDHGTVEAMCLNPDADRYQRMVEGGCNRHEAGRAVDDPCHI
jgi:hypothetical protein